MSATILAIYRASRAGSLVDGTPSGMIKYAIDGPVAVTRLGLDGDIQVDRTVHGGPDKAVHHFPREHYAALAGAFPAIAALLRPGSIGENLSTVGIDEGQVRMGDVYAAGPLRLQVSLPRRPCWKIDRRYDCRGLAAQIAAHGLVGWYYRVLAGGLLAAGMTLDCVERDETAPSVAGFHATVSAARPPLDDLARLADLAGLPAAWRQRLRDRLAWLRRHA